MATNFSDRWTEFSELIIFVKRKSRNSFDRTKRAFSGIGGPNAGTSLLRLTATLKNHFENFSKVYQNFLKNFFELRISDVVGSGIFGTDNNENMLEVGPDGLGSKWFRTGILEYHRHNVVPDVALPSQLKRKKILKIFKKKAMWRFLAN